MKEMFTAFMSRTQTYMQNQDAVMRNLEAQMGQLATTINTRPQGTLPSNSEPNPKNQCNAITLRSGLVVDNFDKRKEKASEDEVKPAAPEIPAPPVLPPVKIPFPE